MAANGNNRASSAKILTILIGVLITMSFSLSSWTAIKAIALDKDLSSLKAANDSQHVEFEKDDTAMIKEARIMSHKIDKTHIAVIKIATKLDIQSP